MSARDPFEEIALRYASAIERAEVAEAKAERLQALVDQLVKDVDSARRDGGLGPLKAGT